jgi:hypothetical protein
MYHRHGCHLCDEVWELLLRLRGEYGFRLEQVDIDQDAALLSEHGEQVPVVLVNGRARFWGRINPMLLRRLFAAGEAPEEK